MTTQAICATVLLAGLLHGQTPAQRPALSPDEQRIADRMRSLRTLPDSDRPGVTKEIALDIRKLPSLERRAALASSLANLSTEGDAGKDTLQTVADTLAQALAELRAKPAGKWNPELYTPLARLVRYEGVKVEAPSDPGYTAILRQFEETERKRAQVTFALDDLTGKQWSLKDLRGKVVIVNFWATWCPPCRKEMPDLETLHRRFKDQGLVVLAISDEEPDVVRKYIGEHPYSFPILLDRGKSVGKRYAVDGIPVSLVYNREGKLVATAVDQRTERQFLELLAKAGLP